ncbi:DUF397 domain-containing protein [Streptomyces sp. XM4193]|uniref:DUF397 domain-containing protein n=1 Tax=Streptomyces sp. XM4193 TaxID=2929782 RepID=UPI001FF8A18C|nr:DUF397 domain-containing protein [Streptomyces sp. XM4193]MCK1794890.1 DUF397 domain-containing protein [Streptomyces sp. XM4193]
MSEATTWIKSSYSGGNGGQCVEFSRDLLPAGVVPVRDSKDTEREMLRFGAGAFEEFVSAVKGGSL